MHPAGTLFTILLNASGQTSMPPRHRSKDDPPPTTTTNLSAKQCNVAILATYHMKTLTLNYTDAHSVSPPPVVSIRQNSSQPPWFDFYTYMCVYIYKKKDKRKNNKETRQTYQKHSWIIIKTKSLKKDKKKEKSNHRKIRKKRRFGSRCKMQMQMRALLIKQDR
ncbi:hypothetical protein B0T19DRAFT_190423 [Cercophora scortea]|uniref:Uncharacterized protein n=1 Tax=Cercophora scortea TaxID=314031 RepID=A0AAE0INE8_9PEZI|nr:hypothetical protein B0T19DRAFT_190423 [Cercophora scortea]